MSVVDYKTEKLMRSLDPDLTDSYIAEEERKADYIKHLEQGSPVLKLAESVLFNVQKLPEVDWQTASKHISTFGERIVLEMVCPSEMYGELYLPESLAAQLTPDVGIVLASGVSDLEPGQGVLYRPYDGTWRIDFEAGDYTAKGWIGCFGVFVYDGDDGHPKMSPLTDSILATVNENMNVDPYRENILVKRNPIVQEAGGLLIRDGDGYRENIGLVIKAGKGCKNVKEGMKILYHPFGVLDFLVPGGDPDLCFMPEASVEAVLS